MKKIYLLLSALVLSCSTVSAQKFSLSTDLLGYAALGTMNLDASCALSRRWSLVAGIRYNPFSYGSGDEQFQLRQQSYSFGARLWPWHIWSGWWFASKIRYQEYNMGGIMSSETEEGDRLGAGLYSGYTYMLSSHFNIEFGLGLWAGIDKYRRYSCPKCGITVGDGDRGFILPDDVTVSLVYVF